ncbi:MAG: HD domain-containing protein [Spirochaetes bacterium]|nr:HD domain-containing protein [Spirochaetota bacterium]
MATERLKIDLTYLGPESMLIYPLYTDTGEKILEARTALSIEIINNIIQKHGKIVYYSFADEMGNIPNHRIYSALNKSREIMDEIIKTDKISKGKYKESEDLIEVILNDLVSSETDTIKLLKDLNSYDDYTYNHSVNVLLLVSVFSNKLKKYSMEELKSLLLGAFLHDIGKMKLDKQLLNKKGKLNVTEFQKMKRHPQLGYEIIKSVASSDVIVQQCILFHHEKYNNKGYYGLPYENLPMFPKIISICDVFDALTSRRPYRNAASPANALKILLNSINNHFDYDLVDKFINILGPFVNNTKHFYGRHEICELNTQELAIIVGLGQKDILKPEIIVFCKYQKSRSKINVKFYDRPFRVNLEEDDKRIMINVLSNEYQVYSIKNRLLERSLLKMEAREPSSMDIEGKTIN